MFNRQYIGDHSDVDFNHSICPKCARNNTRIWIFMMIDLAQLSLRYSRVSSRHENSCILDVFMRIDRLMLYYPMCNFLNYCVCQ